MENPLVTPAGRTRTGCSRSSGVRPTNADALAAVPVLTATYWRAIGRGGITRVAEDASVDAVFDPLISVAVTVTFAPPTARALTVAYYQTPLRTPQRSLTEIAS